MALMMALLMARMVPAAATVKVTTIIRHGPKQIEKLKSAVVGTLGITGSTSRHIPGMGVLFRQLGPPGSGPPTFVSGIGCGLTVSSGNNREGENSSLVNLVKGK